MKIGDIVLSCYTNTTIDAIGVVTGDYKWSGEYDDLNRVRTVKWLVKGIEENILDINGGKTFSMPCVYETRININDVMDIVNKYSKTINEIKSGEENYVFIIDEINRGNISKILETFALVGDKLDIYSGNDDQIVPLLSLGGKGCISVISNILPKEVSRKFNIFIHTLHPPLVNILLS